jgi:hypothetical protein
MSGEQHRFKIKCKCAILIQKSARRDSIVSNSNSTVRLRRLFRQHRSKGENLTPSLSCPDYPPEADMAALYEYTRPKQDSEAANEYVHNSLPI